MPHRQRAASWFVLLLLTGLALTRPVPAAPDSLVFLEVRDTRSRALLLLVPLPSEPCFYLRYTHSTAKTEVEEHFKVADQKEIVLDQMVYASGGAGFPDFPPTGAKFKIADGRFVLEGLNIHFGSLERIRVAYFYPYILGTREAEYRLSDLARGRLVDIRVRVHAGENNRRSQRHD